MVVVDASVVVVALLDDSDVGDRVRDRLRGEQLAAPHLLDVEVLHAWRRLAQKRAIDARRLQLAIVDLTDLELQRVPHLGFLARCWELRDNLTPYDATYVALAEQLEATLLTGDRRIAGAAGIRCAVEVLS